MLILNCVVEQKVADRLDLISEGNSIEITAASMTTTFLSSPRPYMVKLFCKNSSYYDLQGVSSRAVDEDFNGDNNTSDVHVVPQIHHRSIAFYCQMSDANN